MDEHLIINLRVADMRYPLRIKRQEEEVFRKAAEEIDYKIVQYKNYFTGDSSHSLQNSDYMAMTAIQAVAEKVEYQLRANEFESRMKELTQELENYLRGHVK
ncbi:MAG: cell division protein ZapA [Dysgonomonas sp.]|jgi:cell division protein ZapA|uniref:cell division protein ZapA n=1 Tax=unclassified Dysgonomonas TaxID=2630389 RepID=UPI0025C1E731|nr:MULTISPECIES: cell division protein ZapA [unclassified Dysgonomonas]MDR1716732.1 cell division protein ZapA [Prevotella sp.]MDR2004832.1 cell division protein ZapA [Prevotella sp.]HMM01449.1 cell division protein ZapA [Dysgonomonas sp.]